MKQRFNSFVLFIVIVTPGTAEVCLGADDAKTSAVFDVTAITTVDRLPVQRVMRVLLAEGGRSILVHGLRQPDDQAFAFNEMLIVLHAKTGKVTHTLADDPTKNFGPSNKTVKVSPDGKHVFFHGPRMRVIHQYELASGKKVRTLACPENTQGIWTFQPTADGTQLFGVLARPPATVRWNLDDGKTLSHDKIALKPTAKINPRFLFTIKGSKQLGIYGPGSNRQKTNFAFYDLKQQKIARQIELDGLFLTQPWPAIDSEQVLLFRQTSQDDNSLASIDVYDLPALKKTTTIPMKPAITSAGMQRVGPNGRYLVVLSYLVQVIHLYDLKQGKLLGVVAPNNGGVAAFDVAADGKRIAVLYGPWKNGALLADQIGVVDLAPILKAKE